MYNQDKQELLNELKEKFNEMKSDLGLKQEFDDFNKIFFLDDAVLSVGFVSNNISRQISGRIVDAFNNWINYLHSLLMPNPQSMINLHESKSIDEQTRKEIIELITETVKLLTKNTLVGLTKQKSNEKEFLDGSVEFWNNKFNPEIQKIIQKIQQGWDKEKDGL